MVELKGSLSGIGLPAIIQLIGELRHSGCLELTRATAHGELGFDDGQLVSASFGDERGLPALTACTQQLVDADFRFVERPITGERTINEGPAELQRYMGGLLNGDVQAEPRRVPQPAADDDGMPGACPLLGFADDPTRRYSRPTALHRCYAVAQAGLVTAQEQRELCLTARYSTCARFRGSSNPIAIAAQSVRIQSAPLEPPTARAVSPGVAPSQPASTTPTAVGPVPSQPRRVSPAPSVPPPAVAARLNASRTWPAADSPPKDAPVTGGQRLVDEEDSSGMPGPPPDRRRRHLLLLATGAVLGLLVLAALLSVALPALEGRLTQRQRTQDAVADEPAPTIARPPAAATDAPSSATRPTDTTSLAARATEVPTRVVRPTDAPTLSPRTAASTSVVLPVSASGPTAAPVTSARGAAAQPGSATPEGLADTQSNLPTGQSIVDLLFASGRSPSWVDNPPFASWRDGAYRLQAREIPNFVAVGVPVDQPLSDVIVSATFRKTGGPPGGGYGIIVRDQGPEPRDGANQLMTAYVLEVGDQGNFGIWRRDSDHWVDLVPWRPSTTIHVGGSPNDLIARAIGSQLSFMVNGTEVATVDDDALSSGGVGVFVGGDNNEVALDHFTVQIPN